MSISLFNAVPEGAIETILDSDNKPHFKRADLGRFLGIARIKDMFKDVKYMARCDINQGAVNSSKQRQNDHDAFVDLDVALEIITRCNKPKAVEILEKIGSQIYRHKYAKKETTTLSHVQEAFKGEEMIEQYHVDGYRIDLYFPDYNLAIECDEFGHADRNIEYEVKRQKYIEEKLKCSFIRFNPDAEDFNIFRVINRIYQQLC